ncbi:MAG: hypothetical protein DHS20C14_06990 [Phycisphaeraceae bacterium]|nr:MAG: hypothetical protein DHS20C14_06990 [Phycisphaeraceae bacterium]
MIGARTRHITTLRPMDRPAFSLIEVLIAILVLGFGLLGLAAVFPVVVTQQRDAANEMRGPAAAASIKAQVFGPTDFIDWEKVAAKAATTTGGPVSATSGRWNFDTGFQSGLAGNQRLIAGNPDGSIVLQTSPTQTIPVAARLFPSAYGSVSPQFVWDVALRRTSANAPLEAALFVRRLDSGIRVPDGRTLANVLTGEGLVSGGPVPPTAVPVGDTPEGEANDSARRPSGNGTGDYSRIRELRAIRPERADPSSDRPFDRFELPNNASKLTEALAGRVGQKLLDDLGIVHTVLRIDSNDSNDRFIVVEPAFPNDDPRYLIYTPQIPVRVEVIKVETP